MAKNTGNGATITFGGSAVSANITRITGTELSRPSIDISDLASSNNEEAIQGDLTAYSEVEVEFVFDDEVGVPDITAAAASVVITHPQGGLTTAANLTGTAFYTGTKYPDFENNAVQMGSAKIKFDGQTGPTFTAGA